MRLAHPRRQIGIAHVPAADHLPAGVDGRDDVVAPGVGRVIAVAAQESGIAAFGAGLMVAVVAAQLAKAAPAQQQAQLRTAIQGQPLHARRVGQHMGLAGQRQVQAMAGQYSPSVTSPTDKGTRFQVAPWLEG